MLLLLSLNSTNLLRFSLMLTLWYYTDITNFHVFGWHPFDSDSSRANLTSKSQFFKLGCTRDEQSERFTNLDLLICSVIKTTVGEVNRVERLSESTAFSQTSQDLLSGIHIKIVTLEFESPKVLLALEDTGKKLMRGPIQEPSLVITQIQALKLIVI